MRNPRRFVLGLAAIAALVLFLAAPRPRIAEAGDSVEPFGEPWSEERQAKALADGHPVLVVFTAQWCMSCKVIEQQFLFTETVRAAAKRLGAVVLVADFTERDPAIVAELKKHARAGVPFYIVLSPRRGRQPIVLPNMLKSSQQFVDALEEAAAPLPPPYRAVPPDTTRGTIEGTVRLRRRIAVPRIQRLPGCERDVPWAVRRMGGLTFDVETLTLADCIVSLRRIAQGKDWPEPMRAERRKIALVARDGWLGPPVQWVRTGTGVELGNDLPHSAVNMKGSFTPTNGRGPAALRFNVMLVAKALLDPTDDTVLAHAGLYTLRCDCNCLQHMHAQILAFDHPYVNGPTGIDGRYVLDDVPPGDYEVVCWHGPFTVDVRDPLAGAFRYDYGPVVESMQKVTVPARGRVTLDFVLEPPR